MKGALIDPPPLSSRQITAPGKRDFFLDPPSKCRHLLTKWKYIEKCLSSSVIHRVRTSSVPVGRDPVPNLVEDLHPSLVVGEGALGRAAYSGADFGRLAEQLLEHFSQNPNDMGLLMDLSVVFQFSHRREDGLTAQREALARQQLFRVCGTDGPPAEPCLHVLALMAPGDLMTNTPLEFIFENIPARLDLLYVLPDRSLPPEIPDHDLLFVAVSQSDEREPLLDHVAELLSEWPRPVLQDPSQLLQTSREAIVRLLEGASGVVVPPIARVQPEEIRAIADGVRPLSSLAPRLHFPVLIRPVDSHAGKGLVKCEDEEALERYLEESSGRKFHMTQFIDYAGRDGQCRKYRVVLIDGTPYLCHMALDRNWMIHYANAGMIQSSEKRAEEAREMEEFDAGFAQRHRTAFAEIYRRIGLPYLGIDCGETPDGQLLVFEADAAMVIHSMDPPEIFPYKQGQMRRIFDAFYSMLERASRASG